MGKDERQGRENYSQSNLWGVKGYVGRGFIPRFPNRDCHGTACLAMTVHRGLRPQTPGAMTGSGVVAQFIGLVPSPLMGEGQGEG